MKRKGLALCTQAKVSIDDHCVPLSAHGFIHSLIYFLSNAFKHSAGHSARLLGLPILMDTMSLVVFLLSSHTLPAVFLCHFPMPVSDQVGEVLTYPAVVKVQMFGRMQGSIMTNSPSGMQ